MERLKALEKFESMQKVSKKKDLWDILVVAWLRSDNASDLQLLHPKS